MFEHSTVFGIDSHARTTTVCAIVAETGEVRCREFRGNPYAEIAAWMLSFPQPSLGVYESGCTGFHPKRALESLGCRVEVAATSGLPLPPEARSKKSDRRDAERLARAALAGGLRFVWCPDEETEGLRDLSGALEDLRDRARRDQQRVLAFLLRRGVVWDERTPGGRPRRMWGERFWEWLRSMSFEGPAQVAWEALLDACEASRRACASAEAAARGAVAAGGAAGRVDALQALGGVGFLLALAFAAEVGDFGRFRSGRAVTSYFGLAPSERSSGARVRLGGMSRAGSALVRRLLVEGAWCYARCDAGSRKRPPRGVPASVAAEARRGSRRLRSRRVALEARSLPRCKANGATAAELARWCWAVGLASQRAGRPAPRP